MSSAAEKTSGSVVSLWRYPVKSMMGEQLDASQVAERGLLGDRAYALMDRETGKVASAKNPRRWPDLFGYKAALAEDPEAAAAIPPVEITLPDGTTLSSRQGDASVVLSAALGREVKLESAAPAEPALEEYWPDIEDLDHRDTVTDEAILAGTFFDGAAVHLLTTATLEAFRNAYPEGQFEVRRFRPNIVVDPGAGREGFVENAWIGKTLAIGQQVRLQIAGPCPRCVMTTLPQGDLAKDNGILRTAVQQNSGHVGVYAGVLQGGTIRVGDTVRIEE